MPVDHHSRDETEPPGGFLTSRMGMVFLGFLAVVGVLLFTEHRAHVLGALIGQHGGHGGHRERRQQNTKAIHSE